MKNLYLLSSLIVFAFGFSQPIIVNTTTNTVPQLVNDVLINTPCLNVTNITWKTGTDFGSSNGIGFFENTNPNFPIQSGVILSTGNVVNAPGPNNTMLNDGNEAWTGDADLESTLAAAGIAMISANATVLEFDFTPISPNFSFDFIFASEEYGNFQCRYSDAFAFLLTNLNTGVTTNLAVVPNTTIPISVITIRNFLFNSTCPSANESFFGRFNGGTNAATSPTNFNGQTTLLSASSVLTPSVPYHIKLVIADRLDYQSDSAIFLSSNSFNIGQDVLGPDLTIANNSALCLGSSYEIATGLNAVNYSFIWKKDNVILPGEISPTLTVTTPGTYSITYQNLSGNCTPITNSIVIEYSSQISTQNPIDIYRCDTGATNYIFNLDSNTSLVKTGLNAATVVTYYSTEANANATANPLPLQYTSTNNTTIYVRIQVPSGCYVVKSFNLLTAPPPVAIQPPDQNKCETLKDTNKAVFNLINLKNIILGSQSTTIYSVSFFTSQTDANNNTNPISQSAYYNNITFYNSSNTTIYVRAQNSSDPSCFSITSFNLIVLPLPLIDELENVISCTPHTLAPLLNGNYFTAPNGGGTAMFAGDIITETQTIYIFNQPNGPASCPASNSFTVTILDLEEITPKDVTKCDSYILPSITNGNFYTQSGGNGTIIPSGTVINSSQTVYFYFNLVDATEPCIIDSNFQVTILPSIPLTAVQDVFECTSYTLPPLINGKYYPNEDGFGTEIPAGTVITSSQNIYIFSTTGGVAPCITQVQFMVTIGLNAPPDVHQCNGYTLPNLAIGNYYTGPAGSGNILAAGTVINTNTIIYIFQPTTSGQNNCVNNLSFNLSFDQPEVTILPSVSVCGSYILPQIQNGDYFTAQSGGGTQLLPGQQVTSSQTIYIFERLSPTCANESNFEVTIIGLPLIDSRSDIDICNQYILTPLTNGNYYTGPNGSGTMLAGGNAITSTDLIYIYAVSDTTPACSIQNSFQINIFSTTTDAPANVIACDSYTLPSLEIEGSNYFSASGGFSGIGTVIPTGTAITASQTIYVYKEEIIREGFQCAAENSFTVTINYTPVISAIPNVNACDSNELPAITTGNYFTGPNGSGTILAPGTSITSPQTIYVFAHTNTNPDCFSESSFFVNVFNVDDQPDVTVCNSYTLPSLTSGKYYTGTNGSGNQLFAGNTISTSQTIFIFLESNFLPVCSDESSFVITIIESPIANPVPIINRTICDTDGTNDGLYLFNLSQLTTDVLGSQIGNEFTVSYYESMSNAQFQINPVTTSNNATIYVRINNMLTTNCFDIKTINIIVNKLPIPTPVDGAVCIDNETGTLINSYTLVSGLNASAHTFIWTNEANQILGTNATYSAIASGIYTVVATNILTGCESEPVQATVIQSELATVSYIVDSDFADNQKIIITASGFGGDYEYQLDGGAYQDSNIFENVSSGIHFVNVRDKNGCGITPIQVLVINYPKFFTPNDDGYNDTWNIKDLRTNSSARIIIYDRYGKFITSLSPGGAGWNGTYNGKMIPSDDYWFTVYYTNSNNISAEFRAHFSMMR